MASLRQNLSIVVPAYNEEDGLAEFHRRTAAALNELPMHGETIYVNDGSRDQTLDIMKSL